MDAIDGKKLEEFVAKVVVDVAAAMSGALVVIGAKLGLYRALAESPLTPAELADRTGCSERYCREWCNAQAAGGYVRYTPQTGRYDLPAEQALALAQEDGPAYLPAMYQITQAAWAGIPRIEESFRSGGGVAWGHQHPCLFEGAERFFRSAYVANLVGNWLPALDGVTAKLARGARVADVGCGHGASAILMAEAFPRSRFWGFDSHPGSIEAATDRAAAAGVSDRVRFAVAESTDYPGEGYDLVAHFHCLHDMEDPVGAARRARASLAGDGTWMVVEPNAADRPEENHHPIGRLFYSVSTMLCVPHSLSRGGPALGAQAGERRLREVIVEGGGFSRMRCAAKSPFNLVLEARP